MIHLPTTAHPTENQHWPAPFHSSNPATPESCIPLFFRWQNMNIICVMLSNVLVTGGHYPIPIPAPSAPFPSLWLGNHHQDLTSPIFDIGESSGEVRFPL